jgi:hypothetical protein
MYEQLVNELTQMFCGAWNDGHRATDSMLNETIGDLYRQEARRMVNRVRRQALMENQARLEYELKTGRNWDDLVPGAQEAIVLYFDNR